MTHRRGRDLLPVSHPLPIDDLFHYAGTRPPTCPAHTGVQGFSCSATCLKIWQQVHPRPLGHSSPIVRGALWAGPLSVKLCSHPLAAALPHSVRITLSRFAGRAGRDIPPPAGALTRSSRRRRSTVVPADLAEQVRALLCCGCSLAPRDRCRRTAENHNRYD
jgi:hypothetical protein